MMPAEQKGEPQGTGPKSVIDAFQKRSKKGARTPQADIERIDKRLKAAQDHYKRWSRGE
jgi:phage-related protein